MAKTLCEWSKKDIEKKWEKLAELVRAPKFACTKCARSANTGKVLCKPKRLPKPDAKPLASKAEIPGSSSRSR